MKRIVAVLMVVCFMFLLASCVRVYEIPENNLPQKPDENGIDQPSQGEETDIPEEPEVTEVTLTLYFPDNDALYLHPEIRTVEIPVEEPIEYAVVRELFKGPVNPELSPALTGEKLVNSIVVHDGGECVIDFKRDFVILNTGGSTRETFVLGSIVNSLCELEYINAVAFTVEGKGNVEFGHTIIESALKPMPELIKK